MKRLLKIGAALLGVLLVIVLAAFLWLRSQLAGSLPQLDGQHVVQGLAAPVTVERDGLGIPTIRAENRADLAFATGFVHAQDRFFHMDLLRRNSAGELAELVGKAAVDKDRQVRVNRFRHRALKVFEAGSAEDRALMEAYAAGVNAGLKSLAKKPFEYLLLSVDPVEWKPEDSALVMFSMYLDLQGSDFRDEAALGLLAEALPPEMFAFVAPLGTEWDAPIQGEAFAVAATPGEQIFDTRNKQQFDASLLAPVGALPTPDTFHPGSNNWAVSGKHTKDGRALVADDMHLGIRVPHVWYRASFVWPGTDGKEQRMTGVSLPGTPAIVVGSNGRVAWAFTNSEGDWVDVVHIEVDAADKDSYRTPEGLKKFEHAEEVIKVKNGADVKLDVVETIWGPIVDHDHQNRPRAIRWVAHDTDGVNMGLLKMESAQTLEEAIELANLAGSPAQNFVVGDDKGRIAWTIIGRIPRRVGFDGRLPGSWADGTRRWNGYLNPDEYPRIIEPENGKIWTANARVVSGELLAKVGDGGYDLGARAGQIRDDLLATEQATEADMLRIQLDDRATFLERWQKLLLDTLDEAAVKEKPARGELRQFVEAWGGSASIDSVGFRSVRSFRRKLIAQLSDVLVNPCKALDKSFSIAKMDRTEGPVWRLVSQQPPHLIDPRFEDWRALLLSTADEVLAEAGKGGARVKEFTWGKHNTTAIRHPLSGFLPFPLSMFAGKLDMPAQSLAGDSENMPRIQAPSMGASQRMAVSPGREADGYMHMPCGQSGHPLSPHYADSHAAWAEGKPSPFLPGKTVHTLTLRPAAAAGKAPDTKSTAAQ